MCAKSASAATASLGFTGYFLHALDVNPRWLVPIALIVVAVMTTIVLSGIRLSSRVNIVIVSLTLISLAAFIVGSMSAVSAARLEMTIEPLPLLQATALMFVAYTGYGRIATLGEEVREPRTTMPCNGYARGLSWSWRMPISSGRTSICSVTVA